MLWEQLQNWQERGHLPFHMPGHKRNTALAPYLAALGAGKDITEIPDFDDLHAPEGILLQAQQRAAALWGADDCFFSVNGATAGILAGIRAATRSGDGVLLMRESHKAVYHALELCGLIPHYLRGRQDEDFGCLIPPTLQELESALDAQPATKLVILTCPSYEGLLCDLPAMVQAAHAREVAVFVDAAHGAHLGLHASFPAGAVQSGADLVVLSLHKTLPSLTQTALLCRSGPRISREEVQREMGVFQSSSPSYLLLASLEGCISLLEEQGATLLPLWAQNLAALRSRLTSCLRGLQVLPACEPAKFVLSGRRLGLAGPLLAARLREDHQIECEMSSAHYCLAMSGMGDSTESLRRLGTALLSLDAALLQERAAPSSHAPLPPLPPLPERVLSPEQARVRLHVARLLPLEAAVGQLSGEALWAYPPGIPLLLPGERLSWELLDAITRRQAVGERLLFSHASPPGCLLVLPAEEP